MAKTHKSASTDSAKQSPKANATTDASPAKAATAENAKEKETTRDTVESIIFAFVLAFLFRTFEAEAFVIPTGSMAPTLFGRHKDITCEKCNYEYEVGASTEIVREGNILKGRIQRSLCPNCRFNNPQTYEAPPYKGDRILVNKFQYELHPPQRFDVVVFKFPEDSKTNYIKRLIGLPGETIRIHNGNVYRVNENNREEILRKDDPDKQRVIQIPVHDDRYPAHELIAAGWPNRWSAVERGNDSAESTVAGWQQTDAGWTADATRRDYALTADAATSGDTHWLRYRHFAPTELTWAQFKQGDPLDIRPRLIGDFCYYNAVTYNPAEWPDSDEAFWVGDLTINATVTVGACQPAARLTLELTEGVDWFRCHLDAATGKAQLTQVNIDLDPEEEVLLAEAETDFGPQDTFEISFANVDDRLCLWIDDELIDFGPAAAYEQSGLQGPLPLESDYTPVGIAASGMEVTVSDLLLERDIYYRGNYQTNELQSLRLSNVEEWQRSYINNRSDWDFLEFVVPDDNFFVLGDNSPQSSDGRFWDSTKTVPRTAFVGKAFFIYWPHGIPLDPDSGLSFPISYHKKFTNNGTLINDKSYPLHYVPFYPNVWRMQRIR